MENYIKYVGIVLAVVVLGLLVACGGGGGGSSVVDTPVVELPVVVEVSPEDTLEGVVGDNGVRIDVADYIVASYDDEATQDALMQYAKAEQDFVLSGGNETLAVAATRASDRADDCLSSMYSTKEVWDMTQEMLSVSLNTEERTRAYLVADSLLDGHVFTSTHPDERAAMCE